MIDLTEDTPEVTKTFVGAGGEEIRRVRAWTLVHVVETVPEIRSSSVSPTAVSSGRTVAIVADV